MSRSRRGGQGSGAEFWSRRPNKLKNSGIGPVQKHFTHRAERNEGKQEVVAEMELPRGITTGCSVRCVSYGEWFHNRVGTVKAMNRLSENGVFRGYFVVFPEDGASVVLPHDFVVLVD